ncbi:uncharacterized protein LOC118312363 isoform X2 [Scophthalmus maximus]|uniref:uncharacterized protein LOC118312363 isoform X2 n=1 Tax=Scophthalmus maximus TaxID=52904 RepID=UPI001FA8A936|nr:uncharacterized protein LOC118312363 isoform X2 [Scophthalmus maximus]
MDELRLRIIHSKILMDCNVMIFTETWLNNRVPDDAIKLAGRHTLRADRTAADSGKTRGGGLCIYINKAWCTDSVIVGRHCSANLEFLMVKCRPFYQPRELSSTIVTAVYIPPDADAKAAMNELYTAISKQQTAHPEAAFIVAGDFNHSNLKTVLPKFHQHVSCNTRGNKTLDHVYTNIAGAYTTTPLPHLGQSDHLSLFLIPKYSPLIQRVKPSVTTIKVWPAGTDSLLQDKFHHTDWSMFASQATCGSHRYWHLHLFCAGLYQHHRRQCYNMETDHHVPKSETVDEQGGAAPAEGANLRRGIIKAKHCYKLKRQQGDADHDQTPFRRPAPLTHLLRRSCCTEPDQRLKGCWSRRYPRARA